MRRRSPAHPTIRTLLLAVILLGGALPTASRAEDGRSTPPASAATPAAASGRSAPTLAGGPGRTGEMPGPGPEGSPVIRWRAETGADELADDAFPFAFAYPFFLNQEPAVAGGTVFVPAGGGGLVALDAASGRERWRLPGDHGEVTSPTVAGGVVYAGRYDGAVLALDAETGAELWAVVPNPTDPPGGEGDPVLTSAAVVDGTVYAGTVQGTVLALDAATGAERWRVEDPDEERVGSPAVAGGLVYALHSDGDLQALEAATGQERWRFPPVTVPDDGGFFNLFTAYPAVADGLVVFAGPDAAVHALDAATGEERWRLRVGLAGLSSPALVDGVVYVAAGGGYVGGFPYLYALDAATGAVRWAAWTEGLHTPPTVADGVVYAGGAGLTAWAFDAATGEVRWSLDLVPGEYDEYDIAVANTAPAVVDGTVYVGTQRSVADPEARLISDLFAIGGSDAAPVAEDGGGIPAADVSGIAPPEGCLVAPPSPAEFLAKFTEPLPAPTPATASSSGGASADLDALRDGVEATLRRFITCVNADDYLRLTVLMSDELVREVFEVEPAEAPALLAVFSAPHASLPPEMWLEFVRSEDVEFLSDGRAVASVVVQTADGRRETIGPWIFVRAGDRWLIDDFDGEGAEEALQATAAAATAEARATAAMATAEARATAGFPPGATHRLETYFIGWRTADQPGPEVHLTVAPGDEIFVVNDGAAWHNFTVEGLGISVDLPARFSGPIPIPADAQPGTYEFYCNVANHATIGMRGTITIDPDTGAAPTPTSDPDGDQEAVGDSVLLEGYDIGWRTADQPGPQVELTLAPGATIELVNAGASDHNFQAEELGIDEDMPPGYSGTITIPADAAPGTYEFICNVPGHAQAGMVGTITISADAGAAPPAGGSPPQGEEPPAGGGDPGAVAEQIRLEGYDIGWRTADQPGPQISLTVVPGTVIELVNVGAADHNFSLDDNKNPGLTNLNLNVDLPVGFSGTLQIPADAPPGTYHFYCDVPGHEAAGMWGSITVDPGAARADPPEATASRWGTRVPEQRVYDPDGLLAPAERTGLEERVAAVERAGVPTVVYVRLVLPSASAARTEADARDLLASWAVESAPGAADGLVVFVELGLDGSWAAWLYAGPGQFRLTGTTLQRVFDEEMALKLATGDLAAGIGAALDAVARILGAPAAQGQHDFSRVLGGQAGPAYAVAFSPTGDTLAAAYDDGTVRLWDPADADAMPAVLSGDGGSIRSMAFSPNGATLAAAGYDGAIRLWALANPAAPPTVLAGHRDWVWSLAFSPDGATLASAGYDGTVRLWDLGGPAVASVELGGHESLVLDVAISSDGRLLAAGSLNGSIVLWDLRDPFATPTVLAGHDGWVEAVAFSPDGHTLASGSLDATVRLWDLDDRTAAPVVLTGHKGPLNAVAFSPDGRTLASASDDGTIRLWDSGEPSASPAVLTGHDGWVEAVAFSPDGRTLASAGHDGTVRLWNRGDEEPERQS